MFGKMVDSVIQDPNGPAVDNKNAASLMMFPSLDNMSNKVAPLPKNQNFERKSI